MYSYIKGKVEIIDVNSIVLENNGIGYMIYVPNPYSYIEKMDTCIFLYQHVREEENTLYGFKSLADKKLFLKLISVKGLGPKMALPILAATSKDEINMAIETGDVNYLKKFPKVGDKVARQIILDLKGKLVENGKINSSSNSDLIETLKSLGYKPADIKRVVEKIDVSKPLEVQVKEALKLMIK
ncbi:MAG: Holliday junction branch migration protein RuvA [Bacilli bacterium]